jgi:cell division protein FtsB
MSAMSASTDLLRRSMAQLAELPELVTGRPAGDPDGRAAERPDLRVLPGRRRRLNNRTLVALGTLAAFGLFLGLALFQTVLVQNQQRLDQLDREVASAQLDYSRLRNQVATAEAPAHIVEAAEAMGMVQATDTTYLAPSPSAAAASRAAGDQDTTASAGQSTIEGDVRSEDWPEVKASLGKGR